MQSVPDARTTIKRRRGVFSTLKISAVSRIVVVITIVASLTRALSSEGVVHLWMDLVCGPGRSKSGIGQ